VNQQISESANDSCEIVEFDASTLLASCEGNMENIAVFIISVNRLSHCPAFINSSQSLSFTTPVYCIQNR
jgi:hypothetical protein